MWVLKFSFGFTCVQFLLSIYDSNESIDFVHGKSQFFYWCFGRSRTFYLWKSNLWPKQFFFCRSAICRLPSAHFLGSRANSVGGSPDVIKCGLKKSIFLKTFKFFPIPVHNSYYCFITHSIDSLLISYPTSNYVDDRQILLMNYDNSSRCYNIYYIVIVQAII
jgi:hypothetical protein